MSVTPPSDTPPSATSASVPPELRITLGRGAYRWPFRVFAAALAAGLLVPLAARTGGGGAWEPGEAGDVTVLAGWGGALVAVAAVLWALLIYRARLVVTIGQQGLVLRRGKRRAVVPADAVNAVGIVWPVADPVWTVWFDTEAAPDAGTVAKVEGDAATLLRDRSLPSGWLPAVRAAVTENLGARWRVLDDGGEEVPRPRADALAKADRVLVDGRGRYRDQDGGAIVAIAQGRRTIVLRDPHAGRLLAFTRASRLTGRARVRVLGADGRLIGVVNGSREPSFHTARGMLLGSTRQDGDRHVVTGVDGRESASLRTKDDGDGDGDGDGNGDGGRMRLERSRSAPDPLRTLTLALPMVVRPTRKPS
ncbi:hypothetical protein OHR68_16900 [Spirillospora sp. NBC_00431]